MNGETGARHNVAGVDLERLKHVLVGSVIRRVLRPNPRLHERARHNRALAGDGHGGVRLTRERAEVEVGCVLRTHLQRLPRHTQPARLERHLKVAALAHTAVSHNRISGRLALEAAWARAILTVLRIGAALVHASVNTLPVVSLELNLSENVSPTCSVSDDP